MRRVLGNFSFLVKGRGIAAVMLFAVATLMARSLGPIEFGWVVLIQTYALLTRGLLNFQVFEAIVRYGVPAHDAKQTNTVRRLLAVCWRVDLIASIAATIIAVSLASIIGPWLGIDNQHLFLLSAYSFVIIASTGNSTSRGILRLLDQFDIIGKQMTIGPAVRLFGVIIASQFNSSLSVFVAILAFGSIVEDLYLNWYGWREYQKHIGKAAKTDDIGSAKLKDFTGLRKFLWVTYWQSNIDLVPKHVSIMLAGSFLGAADAGLLRLARQFSSLLSNPAVLIRQVVFLDLTRSWQQGSDSFKLIAYRTALLGGVFGLLFVFAAYFFAEGLLNTLVSHEFIGAAPVLVLLLLAATFDLIASPLRSAMYAIGFASTVLRLYSLSAVIYITAFIGLSSMMGLISAGIAACSAALLPPLIMIFLVKNSNKNISQDNAI